MSKAKQPFAATLLLRDATVQEIQLELIRRARPGDIAGDRIVADLIAHRDLWEAALMDTFCFSNPGKLPRIGLLKLRDLPENFWNADSLYILTPDVASARSLVPIAEAWGGMVLLHDDRIIYMDEFVGQRRIQMQGIITEVTPGKRITWQLKKVVRLPVWLSVDFADNDAGVAITHTIRAGFGGIGRLLDPVLQLYRHWNGAVAVSWRTILLSIVDLLLAGLILLGVPVVLERGWDFVLTVSADLGGGLFVIATLLLIVVGVQMVRFFRVRQAPTTQPSSALAT